MQNESIPRIAPGARKSSGRTNAEMFKVIWDTAWGFINLSPLGTHLWKEGGAAKKSPVLLLTAIVVSGVATWYFVGKRAESFYSSPIYLRVVFPGGTEVPRFVDAANVYRWYALSYPRKTILADGGPAAILEIGWTIFLVFDRPVDSTTMNFHSSTTASPKPLIELKDFGPRSAIIVINDNMPAGMVELRFEPVPKPK